MGIADGVLGKELSSLAKEVARMETVRMYAGELLFPFFLDFFSEYNKCSSGSALNCWAGDMIHVDHEWPFLYLRSRKL